MLLREVMELLEEQSPLYYACDWDNSGLLAGRSNQDIRKIYIALTLRMKRWKRRFWKKRICC